MSWRSSCSVSWSRSQSAATSSLWRLARGVDQDARQRHEPREALRADRRRLALAVLLDRLGGALHGPSELGRLGVALDHRLEPPARLLDQLGRTLDARVLAKAQHPGHHLARVGVVGLEDHALVGIVDLAGVAEVAQREPVDPVRQPDSGAADRLAQLPVGADGVVARVELLRAVEVVLGLGRVAHLAADARHAEDPQRAALVRPADQVELPALVQQVVGVDLAALLHVAADRVVVEHDRLAAEDRRLELREALRQVAATGAGLHGQRDRALLGRVERRGLAPGELLERQAQRLRVGELAVQERQRHAQRAELLVGELDRREVEVLGRQRVVLGLVVALGRLVDLEMDAERLELGAVGVEAACEGLVVHLRVAFDVLLDLERRHGPALGHQEGDQRELADEFLGVLRHRPHNDKRETPAQPPPAGARVAICGDPHALRAVIRPQTGLWAAEAPDPPCLVGGTVVA